MAEKAEVISNPNGANQWQPDPRQQLFIAYWKDPKSPTFSDVKNSALRAGFAKEYSDNLTYLRPDWFLVAMGHLNPLLAKAERNFNEHLDLPSMTQAMGAFGPIFEKVKEKVENGTFKNGKKKYKTVIKKVPVMVHNPSLLKIREQVSEFVAETVGKKTYSKKGTEGAPVFNIFMFENAQRARIAKRIVGGRPASDTDGERESR